MEILTIRIGLEINLSHRTNYVQEGRIMGWIDDFLKEQAANRAADARRAELENMGRGAMPRMFAKLSAEVTQDVLRYTAADTRRPVNVIPDRDRNATCFDVRANDRHPSALLKVAMRVDGTIDVTRTTKRSTDADNEYYNGIIYVMAKGQDDYFYRLDGRDFLNESDLSRQLLRPLLEFIG